MEACSLFSDLPSNLPGLRGVMAEIEARDVDAVFCLGDLVDFAPWPNEVIDLVRGRRWPVVMGNHDERIALHYPVEPSVTHTAEETAARVIGVEETRRVITERNRAYLGSLPREVRMGFGEGRDRREVLLVHASPRGLDDHIYEDHPLDDLEKLFREARADVVVMGHTHYPYVRRLEGFGSGDRTELLAVNCGSVGRLKEDVPMASYALLTVEVGRIEAEVVRLPYLIEETIAGIRASGVPGFYAEFLERRAGRGAGIEEVRRTAEVG